MFRALEQFEKLYVPFLGCLVRSDGQNVTVDNKPVDQRLLKAIPQDQIGRLVSGVSVVTQLVQRANAYDAADDALANHMGELLCVCATEWARGKINPEEDMTAFQQAFLRAFGGASLGETKTTSLERSFGEYVRDRVLTED